MKVLSFDVGLKNLAYCYLDNSKIKYWETSEIIQKRGEDLCHSIVRHLDTMEYLQDVNVVLIEKQPSKNNKMRIIEALLNAYYVIKCPNAKVCVYSAKHKLTKDTFRGKTNYKERKKLSINRCNAWINDTSQDVEFIDKFSKSKKKDDFADSLLQALSYMNDSKFLEVSKMKVDNITKISSRKPTQLQEKKGYSKSNIKYIIQQNVKNKTKLKRNCIKLTKALNKWYPCESFEKSLESAMNDMSIHDVKINELL